MRTKLLVPPTLLGCVLAVAALVTGQEKQAAQKLDPAAVDFFEKKIRPVLVEHCYQCHSQEKKQRGGLSLDTRDAILKGGDTGPAVVPGKPNESLLIHAVRYTRDDVRMPPKGKLPANVIADLEKWVAMGAPDPRVIGGAKKSTGYVDLDEGRKFWAYQPLSKAPAPKVKDEAWPRSDMDRFLLAKLEEKGLKPAPDADRATLIRRFYFDLIGLPPSPEEIDAFVKDNSPEAIVKLVDRLLALPQFGERWGRHWLDVARFAESSGGGRTMMFKDAWRYRDYVINAFNTDKPFDQFILEQIAGDLIEAKSPEERYWTLVATAFLILGPHNYERQDKPVLEMDIIDEQLDTIGKGFLGMTIGCARCHDHKFDPIPTKDYYALAGIFKSTKFIVHSNVSKWMERPLPASPDVEQKVKAHEAAVAALQEKIKLAKKLAGKEDKVVAGKGTPLNVADLPGIVIDDTKAQVVGSWKKSTFSGLYVGEGYLYDDRAKKEEKTVTFQPEIPKTGFYEVRLAYVPFENRASNVFVRIFHVDGDEILHINQKKTPPIDGRWLSLGKYRFSKSNQWFVMLSTEGANGHVVADAVQFLPEDDNVAAGPGPKKVIEKVPQAAAEKAVEGKLDLAVLEAELKKLQASAPERPQAMAVQDGDKIEDFHVCVRGNVHNKGEKVKRGFLQVATVGKMPELSAKESGRRELAQWLASKDNPLTARVFVNRVWHHLFGQGIVRTVDNFGSSGERPSHPELLDYLARRFMEQGWSMKKIIREIVLSRAYQMASVDNPAGKKADPENRLLWKMNRKRLEAECLRDTILLVSGDLDKTVGGPNIKKGTTAERDYKFEDTRRSVYTPIFRNRLLELFEVFDFADPNMVYGKRNVSTVPTQALYLMNSPFVMEQAKKAADLLLKVQGMDDGKRVDLAYRKCLGRLPSAKERELALAYVGAAGEQRAAAWERFYQTLFACIDFRYVN